MQSVRNFPSSPKASHTKHKLVGIIGGEPLLHPGFEALAVTMKDTIPYENRGLWTGLRWEETEYADVIRRVFPDYGIHRNMHDTGDLHSPVLVASEDVELDDERRRELIDNCWLQRRWASTLTPWGFYCCEVMGCLGSVLGIPGLPIEPGCWERPIGDFKELVDTICRRCGIPLNFAGRQASDTVDDISTGNLERLKNSPKIQEGRYKVFDSSRAIRADTPWRYKR
jgi:hypothetical protein